MSCPETGCCWLALHDPESLANKLQKVLKDAHKLLIAGECFVFLFATPSASPLLFLSLRALFFLVTFAFINCSALTKFAFRSATHLVKQSQSQACLPVVYASHRKLERCCTSYLFMVTAFFLQFLLFTCFQYIYS